MARRTPKSDMDQQRRLLTFTVLSFLILFGWMSVGPKLFPGMFPQPPKPPVKKVDPKIDAITDGKGADEKKETKTASPTRKSSPSLMPNYPIIRPGPS